MFIITMRDEDGTHFLEWLMLSEKSCSWAGCRRAALVFHTRAYADKVAALVDAMLTTHDLRGRVKVQPV